MKNYLALLIILCCAFSCEEVIDLNLEATSGKIVIQANIYDQPGPYIIKLSKTVAFSESSTYPPVTDAIVILSDNHSNIDTLTEKLAGMYVTSKISGINGYTYTLTVISEGKKFTSISTMPSAVNIDSIYTAERVFNNEKYVGIKFKDSANVNNYYRIVEYINKKPKKAFYTISDELYDGKEIKFSVMQRGPDGIDDEKLKSGDSVTVWLECVDKGAYDYFRTANEDMSQSASPANPISNISNGALGYFNTCSVRTASILVP